MTFAISHILVPFDFSSHSELALRYADALARRVGASVDILHVVEDPVATGAWNAEVIIPDLPALRKELVDEAEHRLERLRTAAEGVPTITTVRMGPTAPTIVEYAKELGVDLIVMGTHGRSGLAHLFMGSVAERVVRHAPCPVLTLRAPTPEEKTAAAPASERGAVGAALGRRGTSRE